MAKPTPNPAGFGPNIPDYFFDGAIKNTGIAQLQATQALAASLQDQTDLLAVDLTNINFPPISVSVDYSTSGQYPTLTITEPPEIDRAGLSPGEISPLVTRSEPTKPSINNSSLVPGTIDRLPERTIGPAPVVDTDDFIVADINPLPTRIEPAKPVIDYTGLDIDVDDSQLIHPDLLTLEDLERLELRPTIYRDIVSALATKLLSLLDQATGLPLAWEEATWARARDRLTKEQLAQESAIAAQFSAAGWDMPTGMETARVNAVRERFIEAASGVSRDIALKVFEEALISLRLGMELAARFYELWPIIYQADLSAQTETERNKTAQNAQLLQKLQAAIQIFDTEHRAENTRINARLGVIQSKLQTYQTDSQTFGILRKSDVDVRQGDIDVETTRIDAVSKGYNSQSDIYNATANALGELIRGDIGQQQGAIAIEQLEVGAANTAYQTKASVYDSQMRGFGTLTQRDLSTLNSDLDIERLRIRTLIDSYGLDNSTFATQVQQETAVAQLDAAGYGAFTQRQQIAASAQIQNNQGILGERRADIAEAGLNSRAVADLLRQTTSSIWQSTNIGLSASFGESTSHNKGASHGVGYNYTYSEDGGE